MKSGFFVKHVLLRMAATRSQYDKLSCPKISAIFQSFRYIMSEVDKDYVWWKKNSEKNIKMLENKCENSQLSKKYSPYLILFWCWHLTIFLTQEIQTIFLLKAHKGKAREEVICNVFKQCHFGSFQVSGWFSFRKCSISRTSFYFC